MTSLQPRPDDAVQFLDIVRPNGLIVLVAIRPDVKDAPSARSFAVRERDELGPWIKSHNEAGENIYWTVNSVARPIAKKPAREDISTMDFLHVDVDPDKRKSFAEERQRIETLFATLPTGVPEPTLVVDSGGGLQAFWRLETPMRIDGNPELYEDAKRWNQQLEILFGGDSCHNVDRIMRVPGTINWPDAKKRAAERVPTLASVVRHTPIDYKLSLFTPAAQLQSGVSFATNSRVVETGNVQRLLSLDELPPDVSGMVKVVINQGMDPDNPNRWPSRSEPLFWVCCELIRAGVSDDTVYSIITDPDFKISESVVEKGARAEKYALQQIEHAHEHCTHPMLAELNRKHAVIGDLGGKCRIISEGYDDVLERPLLSYQSFDDFYNRYANRFVPIDEKQVALGKWWVQHPLRRTYDRVVFAPGHDAKNVYNLWQGFACEAVPGDCSLYYEHILKNICRGDNAAYEYILNWMALAVQRPGDRGHTAVVLRGLRGAGKGEFAQWFGRIFGRHFMQITNPVQLVGQFNHHLKDCVVLFADEAFYAGDKRHEAVLKGIVTEAEIVTEAKYHAAEMAKNCLHIIMAANEDWVVPAGAHERRFLVLDVGTERLQDKPFFRALKKQMGSGGQEGLLYDLMRRDLTDFEPRDVPKTTALQEQKEHSLSVAEAWWHDKLLTGEVISGEGWPEWIAVNHVLFDFHRYANEWARGQRVSKIKLSKLLEKAGCQKRQYGGRLNVPDDNGNIRQVDRPRIYLLPALADARAKWEALMGGKFDWDSTLSIVDHSKIEEPFK